MKNVMDEIKSNGYKSYDVAKNYENALENPVFADFVSKLKLDSNKLMKYTTTLEECCSNYNACLKCKGLVHCVFKLEGYCYLPKVIDGRLEFDYQPCKYMKKHNKDKAYQNNVYYVSLPKAIREASFKNIYNNDSNRYDAIIWINAFLGNYRKGKADKGLYLSGNFGCGKSYLISALFNELAKDGVRSAILFWPEFLRDLKASFSVDFKEKYEYIKNAPLLLIDDIGAEATTEWSRDEIFCPLVQYRMDEHLPTFFTSNYDLKALEEHFSITRDNVNHVKARRIIERISQLTEQVTMISKNLRD